MNDQCFMSCFIKTESDQDSVENTKKICLKARIPRPPNAFMLYANENRKIMSQQYPAESNKDISKKLGTTWKSLNDDEKNKYFERARNIDLEHKKKYPDYVYNPKEARIRKAMREAASRERDRAIGASPMLARPSARRAPQSHGWTPTGHEDLMMSPLAMRAGPDSPRYPAPAPVNGHADPFLVPGAGYAAAKMRQEAVSHNAGYGMQSNPLTQMHQQTEMWNNFQDEIRPRPSNPFMLPQEIPSPYSHHQPSPPLSIPSPHMPNSQTSNHMPTGQTSNHMPSGQTSNHMTSGQTPHHMPTGQTSNHMPSGQTPHHMPTCQTPHHMATGQTPNMQSGQTPHPLHSLSAISMPMTPPYANENVPPDEWALLKEGECKGEQRGVYGEQQPVDGGEQSQQLQPQQRQVDKTDNARSSKKRTASSKQSPRQPPSASAPTKALPDFNEAFGATERGRFQSPPDPRLGPRQPGYLDLFYGDGCPPPSPGDFHL